MSFEENELRRIRDLKQHTPMCNPETGRCVDWCCVKIAADALAVLEKSRFTEALAKMRENDYFRRW